METRVCAHHQLFATETTTCPTSLKYVGHQVDTVVGSWHKKRHYAIDGHVVFRIRLAYKRKAMIFLFCWVKYQHVIHDTGALMKIRRTYKNAFRHIYFQQSSM